MKERKAYELAIHLITLIVEVKLACRNLLRQLKVFVNQLRLNVFFHNKNPLLYSLLIAT